ncbi:Metal-dependent hydrolases of the beta-lactamase superfamily I, partial [human gut metagenome]
MNLGIQIYTNDETVEHLKIITGELMKGVPEKRPFRVGSFTVIPFYLPHTT